MKNIIVLMTKIFILVALAIAIVAPFTFQKPLVDANKPEFTDNKSQLKNKLKLVKSKVVEKPLHNVALPDFASIVDVKQKKKLFFDFIRPAIIKKNKKILSQRKSIELMLEHISLEQVLTEQENKLLEQLIKKYKVNRNSSELAQLNELLVRVDIVPTQLVLVQAANESAWGTSRFARIGLNFFGIWCYREGCGMVPGGRNKGAKHEVAAFQSVEEAIKRYFYNINTHNAYRILRTIRSQLRAQDQPLNPEILATGLLSYSERGTAYILDITDMLRHNQTYFNQQKSELVVSE